MVSRRTVLAAASTMAVGGVAAGCTTSPGGGHDVSIANETATPITVVIDITATGQGSSIVSEELSIEPEEWREYEEVTDDKTVMVSIAVRNGPQKTKPFSDGSYDSRSISFIIYENSIEVFQGSA